MTSSIREWNTHSRTAPASRHGVLGLAKAHRAVAGIGLALGLALMAPAAKADSLDPTHDTLTDIISTLRDAQNRLAKSGARLRDAELQSILGRLDRAEHKLARARVDLGRASTRRETAERVDSLPLYQLQARLAATERSLSETRRKLAGKSNIRGPETLDGAAELYAIQARISKASRQIALANARNNLRGKAESTTPKPTTSNFQEVLARTTTREAPKNMARFRPRADSTSAARTEPSTPEPRIWRASLGDASLSGTARTSSAGSQRDSDQEPSPAMRDLLRDMRQRLTKLRSGLARTERSIVAQEKAELRRAIDSANAQIQDAEDASFAASLRNAESDRRIAAATEPPIEEFVTPAPAPARAPAAAIVSAIPRPTRPVSTVSTTARSIPEPGSTAAREVGNAVAARLSGGTISRPMRKPLLTDAETALPVPPTRPVSVVGVRDENAGPAIARAPDGGITGGPIPVLERFQNVLLEVSRDHETLSVEARRAKLAPVVRTVFDLRAMSKFAVGDFWDQMSATQRQELTRGFGSLMIALIADRFDFWYDQSFQNLDISQRTDTAMEIETQLVLPFGFTFPINFLAHERDGRWYLIDVMPGEGYSEVWTRRGEFTSVLRRRGVDGFFEALDSKLANIEDGIEPVALASASGG